MKRKVLVKPDLEGRMRARLLYYIVYQRWREATRLRSRMKRLGFSTKFIGFDD